MRRKLLLFILPGIFSLEFAQGQKPVFYQDIAPVIHSHCTTCHRPDAAAPFSLISYEDVAKRAHFIEKVITTGYMPPWRADTSYVHYCNERVLTQREVQLITRWVSDGMPKGKKNFDEAQILRQYTGGTAYSRPPDLVIKMDHPFRVKGDNKDRFVMIKLPYALAEDKNVEAVEFFANNKKFIHHANYAFYDTVPGVSIYTGGEPAVTLEDPGQAFAQFDPYMRGGRPMVHYGGWIPGSSYESFPADMGFVLPKKGVVVLTLHFAPTAVDTEIVAGLHLFFKKEPIKRKVEIISIGSGGVGQIDPPLVVFANSVDSFYAKAKTTQDQSLLYVWPHMHLLGKSFKAFAVTPAGDTIPLVRIPRWDFSWQELYEFKKLVYIPRGSVITVKGVYDNTRDNPRNPNNPPKTVFSDEEEAMRTTDEMLTLIFIYVPYQPGDENISLCN